MPGLSVANFIDRQHLVPEYPFGASDLVPGDPLDQPSQDRFVRPVLETTVGRQLPTAWLIQQKLMQAMAERDAQYTPSGLV